MFVLYHFYMRKNELKPLRLFIIIFGFFILSILMLSSFKNKEEEIIVEEKTEGIEIISGIKDNTNKEKIYLAVGDSYKLSYEIVSNKKDTKETINYSSSDENIVVVDENGLVKAINPGEITLAITCRSHAIYIDVVSTDLILPIDNDVLYTKPNLKCNTFTEDDNHLLDAILEDRINDAGYNTRAGVVAAARFLLLEFPYRIEYFSENGRLANGIDGEGRYYHKGLYLSEPKFKDLKGSSSKPKCWGCSLYSGPATRSVNNGLDCSGFVTWVLLNGGFDVGDVGAGGINYSKKSLFYFGDRENISLENISKIQAGDLVHNEKGGGHIGVVVGVSENKIYVGQATWPEPRYFKKPYGVTLTEYTFEEFAKDWNEVMLMDSYYKENGNYTAMW